MLLILCSQNSPRLEYTVSWICNQQWRLPFEITANANKFKEFAGPKISYDLNQESRGALPILPSSLLFEQDIKHLELNAGKIGDMPVLFKNESELGFDILSAVFYMLSRYEEYLPYEPDNHGRFAAKNSTASLLGFIRLPVVDMWVDHLHQALQKRFPSLHFHEKQFDAMLTYDIDVAYKYKGKSFFRNAGGLIRDLMKLSFSKVIERLGVITGLKEDPWDTYHELIANLKGSGIQSIFFFPAGKRSAFDNHLLPGSVAVSKLITRLASFSKIGLHPSYYSSEDPLLISIEKAKLETVLGSDITISRQHFLKIKLPDTYLALIECGITKDFSMGFPDLPGFRAGTSHPFYFYDLKNEKQTGLELFPCCCMEQTFIHYLQYNAGESLEVMKNLLESVRKYNGLFIPIFHNHCLEKKDWMRAHDLLIKEIESIRNQNATRTSEKDLSDVDVKNLNHPS